MDLMKAINFKNLDIEFGLIGKSLDSKDNGVYFCKSDLKVVGMIGMVKDLNLVFTTQMANFLNTVKDKNFIVIDSNCSKDELFNLLIDDKESIYLYYSNKINLLMVFHNDKLYTERFYNHNKIEFKEIKFDKKHDYILNTIYE